MNQFPYMQRGAYRGALVYQQEDGYLWITITVSIALGETSQVITHAYNLPISEEAEHLPGLDVYHFAVSPGTLIQLAIVSETQTTDVWYSVTRNTVIACVSSLALDLIRSSAGSIPCTHPFL